MWEVDRGCSFCDPNPIFIHHYPARIETFASSRRGDPLHKLLNNIQGLNMRDSGCDVSYALRKDRIDRMIFVIFSASVSSVNQLCNLTWNILQPDINQKLNS